MRLDDHDKAERQGEEPLPHQHEKMEPPDHASLRDRLAHFTWPWFAATMSTGAVAVVLAQTPNRFPGLDTIGKVFFMVDLAMFSAFNMAMAARFVIQPRKLAASLHHPIEGLFYGAYWVSVSLILNCMQSYAVPRCGSWLIKALDILFWMYCGTVLIVAIAQYYIFFQEERLKVSDAMPAWIFPIYPLLVVGPMAGTMIPSQPQYEAFSMWVGAVMLQGAAWLVALMMYSIYTQRLMTSSLPRPPTRPGMYVSVGPAGYTSAALISLGTQAPNVLATNTFNLPSPSEAGAIVKVLGIIAGIGVLLFSFWFFCISTIAVLADAKRMTFTLNWWAFVFPNAGLTLAAIQMGKAFQSPGVNGVCSALTVALVVMWLFTATAHIRAVWQGKILWPGRDEDKDMKGVGWGARRRVERP